MIEYVNRITGRMVSRNAANNEVLDYDGRMMIVEMDKDRYITYTNRKFRDMVGYSKEELVGLPYESSFHPDMPEGLCRQAFEVAEEGGVWMGFSKTIARNGAHFWSAVCLQPKYDIDQNMTGYIIRKKGAEKEILEKVKREFSALKQRIGGAYQSEYCGILYDLREV